MWNNYHFQLLKSIWIPFGFGLDLLKIIHGLGLGFGFEILNGYGLGLQIIWIWTMDLDL